MNKSTLIDKLEIIRGNILAEENQLAADQLNEVILKLIESLTPSR